MKTFRNGFKILWEEQSWVLIGWVVYLVLSGVAILEDPTGPKSVLCIVIAVTLFPAMIYAYGRTKTARDDRSPYEITENKWLSMRVVRLGMDTVTLRGTSYGSGITGMGVGISRPMLDSGIVDSLCIEIVNGTGAPIVTDTSFELERQRGLRWYRMTKGADYGDPWERLEIPEGTSAMTLTLFGRYDTLPHGAYRAVKTFRTAAGSITAAAFFSFDAFH